MIRLLEPIQRRWQSSFLSWSSRRNKNSELSYVAEWKLMSVAVLEIPRKNLRRLEANERPSSFKFRVHPRSWTSSGSPVYNFRFRCPCKERISGSFRIEISPVRLRLLPFRMTVFNLTNNLFYDDFIGSWRQTAIWSSKYWIVIPTFGFHGNNKCEFCRLKFKILSKTSIFWRWYELEV